ncbi:DUF7510 family protein [Halogeometricum limi]|uniref:Uncharacterized protein n=1 Tax=Halogeometricum limi TaxID=555875 RepID=A0A1I6GLA8_9EURY|nr:hypothetical protein [Halogeometricum limi]SFR42847.1 hypothetical protein SAMN04488124_1203 [Halogeometricum limi]
MSDAATDSGAEQVSLSVNIEDGETVITMRGDRDTAVVVESEVGERIYLPPEDFERDARRPNDSPYQSARQDSPYQSAREDSPYQSARDDSPYQAARQSLPREGLVPTADGYRIRHPEPVTDVRLLR